MRFEPKPPKPLNREFIKSIQGWGGKYKDEQGGDQDGARRTTEKGLRLRKTRQECVN